MQYDKSFDQTDWPWAGDKSNVVAGQVKDFQSVDTIAEFSPVIVGFCHGLSYRPGSELGPQYLRRSLAALSWQPIRYLGSHSDIQLYDAGTVSVASDEVLDEAQQRYADKVVSVLERHGRLLGLGGSHELIWADFIGLSRLCESAAVAQQAKVELGFLNISAELMLSDGAVFDRIAKHQQKVGNEFHCFCLGTNPAINQREQFDRGAELELYWRGDVDCTELDLPTIDLAIRDFLSNLTVLSITLDISCISAAYAPGVNCPAAMGLAPHFVLRLLYLIRQMCEDARLPLLSVNVIGFNPQYDIDGRTESLVARLLHAIIE